jgi:alpha-1,3-rhamnosyltransferase
VSGGAAARDPLVSVGIPSYNHAPYLAAAIESVLGQTLSDFELVIADDGSTDGTLDIARRYAEAHPDRVTVLTHPDGAHLGLGPTVNLCRRRLRAGYIIGLPSDDVLYPRTLEREAEFLDAHPDVGYVYGYATLVDASGRRLPDSRTLGDDITRGGRVVERLVQGNQIPAMTVMIRRECLESAGPEDESLVYGDWEFHTRAAAHWAVGFIPRPLAMHRVHATSTSLTADRETNLERALAVTRVMRERAPRVGGALAAPRVRAALELQMAFLDFASGDESAAARRVRAAFERDPTLAGDGRWLGQWVWDRLLDRLLPPGGPDFTPWLAATVTPLLDPRAARVLRREAAAAKHAERAIQLGGAGRSAAGLRAALAAVARSPRRIADRGLAAVLLDSVGRRADGLRGARRRLLYRAERTPR